MELIYPLTADWVKMVELEPALSTPKTQSEMDPTEAVEVDMEGSEEDIIVVIVFQLHPVLTAVLEAPTAVEAVAAVAVVLGVEAQEQIRELNGRMAEMAEMGEQREHRVEAAVLEVLEDVTLKYIIVTTGTYCPNISHLRMGILEHLE